MKPLIKLTLSILIISCFCNLAFSQVDQASPVTGHTGGANTTADYLGWANTVNIPLDINHKGAYPINFYTANTQRMTIQGATNPGFVGIGYGFTPSYKLDVDTGDVNINITTFGFRINSNYVHRHNGIISSIYVGVGAGNTNGTVANTFVGNNTGLASGTTNVTGINGSYNTFVGYNSGKFNESTAFNLELAELFVSNFAIFRI